MNFPRLVFKNGGPFQRAGGNYSYMLVSDDVEHGAAVKAGWSATLPEAIEAKPKPVPVEDDAPPTREELEAKLKELGKKFHHKMSDATLTAMIKESLEG